MLNSWLGKFRGQGSSRDIMLNSSELGMVSPELPSAPGEPEATSVSIKATDLIMLLGSVDLQSVKRRPRYVRESA